MGHEGCGIVKEVGPGVTTVQEGDKVVMHWRPGSGIESEFPKYHLGEKIISSGKCTTLSEFSIVSQNRVTKVPSDTPTNLAAMLGCSLTSAMGIIDNECHLKFGESVAVIGCGGVGLNLIQAAKMKNAYPVDGVDINDKMFDLTKQIGVDVFTCDLEFIPHKVAVRENSPCVDGGLDGAQVGCFAIGCGPINLGPVWYVDQNGDNASDGSLETPFETIEKAVNVSIDGDTIRLNPGVYTELIEFDGKQIVLESRAFELDSSELIFETYFGPGPLGGTCFSLDGNDDNYVTIRGISFRGGSDPYGGGIVISNCSPILESVIVEDNTAEIGGGIYLSNSDAILKNIQVRNNGGNLGGGIYITGGSPFLDGVLIHDNIAYWGGGIYIESANPIILESTIRTNDAFIEGAGIYQNGGTSSVSWTSFDKYLHPQ
jgi:hypothetical protein